MAFMGLIEVGYKEVAAFFVFYFLCAFSLCAGNHRYFSHHSFSASPILRYFFILMSPANFMNSSLKWARDHRHHHAYTESEKDPYSIAKGFWYAHIGWAILSDEENSHAGMVDDLELQKDLVWQDKHILGLSVFMGLIIPTLIGYAIGNIWFGVLFIGFVRIFFFHHSIFLINSYCHTFGSRPIKKDVTATNSLLVAFLTLGDGYHHNHHVYVQDYRAGYHWYDWDPVKWILVAFNKVGLVHKLRTRKLNYSDSIGRIEE